NQCTWYPVEHHADFLEKMCNAMECSRNRFGFTYKNVSLLDGETLNSCLEQFMAVQQSI
ncbi:hypothetical protein P7K49_000110, partial [Saguinus oedipus]